MRPRHSHSEPDSESPGLIFSSSAAQEVNLSTGTLRTRKTWCQSTTKPRKIGVLGVPPSIPPYPRTRVSRLRSEIDLKYFGGAYALSPAKLGPLERKPRDRRARVSRAKGVCRPEASATPGQGIGQPPESSDFRPNLENPLSLGTPRFSTF